MEEPSVGKADEGSGQWVEITMKKVHGLLSMIDGDEMKHVLDYTHVDLHYVEDQRKNLVNRFNLLKQELSLHKSELCNLKNTVSINCSLQIDVIRVNLKNESLKDEISNLKKALGGRGKKANESLSMSIPEITSDSESECETQEPLPPLPKLLGAAPTGTSNSLISLAILTLNMADLTFNTSVPKTSKPTSDKVKMEKLNEVRAKELGSDNGTEFRNHKLEELCDEKGISHNFSSPCTLEQNGIA
ncbi:retrovirus-related pol polyprotein from transposon TNT 1-94 [Tanacetum coccineum]